MAYEELRKIRNYGNSCVVSIPQRIIQILKIKIPQEVVVGLAKNTIVIKMVKLPDVEARTNNIEYLPE